MEGEAVADPGRASAATRPQRRASRTSTAAEGTDSTLRRCKRPVRGAGYARRVRELFAGRRLGLLTLMLGVALGWSLFEIARGIGVFVTTLLKHVPNEGLYQYQPLAW